MLPDPIDNVPEEFRNGGNTPTTSELFFSADRLMLHGCFLGVVNHE
jgi:hypothetical protein